MSITFKQGLRLTTVVGWSSRSGQLCRIYDSSRKLNWFLCRSNSVAASSATSLSSTRRNFQTSAAKFHATEENDPMEITNKEWKEKLTPEQYFVTREKGTEMPFSGKYLLHGEKGIYTCICCEALLFSSEAKFDSHSGWPSFYEAYGAKAGGDGMQTNILARSDNKYNTNRTEVICKKCDAHLGHVFDDGPQPTGLRFCINSDALNFKKEA